MIINQPARYGDLKKFIVKIDGKDVSQAVSGVTVFQDVFTPTWSMQARFQDTSNLLMTVPIKQGSKIEVTVETELNSPGDGEKTFRFIIYKIGDKILENAMHQIYTVFGVDDAYLKNQGTKVRKSFVNMKATDIAGKIAGEFLDGHLEKEDSEENITCIIPGWSPFNALAWLCKSATNKGAADYLLFQRDSGKFVMKPLEYLYTRESSGITFFQRPADIRENGEYVDDYSVAIIKYSWEHFDALANITGGYFRNKLLTYNMVTKVWEEHKFTFGQDCSKDLEGKNFELDAGEDASVSFMPKHPQMHEKPTYLDTNEIWETSRKSSMLKMDQERLLFQVPGSVGANEWIGKNCTIDLPTHEDMSDEVLDKHRKGRYLIIAIAHVFSKEGYLLNIEAIKKRLEEPV